MSQSSPCAKRVVSVLNFFAEHPDRSFTFTEIVRALKMGKATCHSLLTGLVEAHYLYRNGDKTYVIGPALVAIGRIASKQFSPMQAAEPEVRALADQFHATCSVIALEKDHAVVKTRAGTVSDFGWAPRPDARMPLRASAGAPFFAWSSEADIEEWLAQLSPAPSEEQQARFRAGIAFTREHGFAFGIRNSLDDVAPAGISVENPATSTGPVAMMAGIDHDLDYYLAYLVAPVFDEKGKVVFVLSLSGFPGVTKGDQVEEMGAALNSACQRISDFIAASAGSPQAASVFE